MPKLVRPFRLSDDTQDREYTETVNRLGRDVSLLEDTLKSQVDALQVNVATLQAHVATLQPKVPIAKAYVSTDGSGGVTITTDNGFSSASIVSQEVRCTFTNPTTSTDYLAFTGYTQQTSGGNDVVANATDSSTTSYVSVLITDISTGATQNPGTEAISFAVVVFSD